MKDYAPIHPDSLRGRINIHGHKHNEIKMLTLLFYIAWWKKDNYDMFMLLMGIVLCSIFDLVIYGVLSY